MINLFNKNFKSKILIHILILLISFFISYLVFSNSNNKNSNISRAYLTVHAPCNVLHYASDLYALMEKFRKKSILISHRRNVQCVDYSLFKFDFIFKTKHEDHVKTELKNYVLFNLDNHEAIKTEIREKLFYNENLIKALEVNLELLKLDGIDYNKAERNIITNDLDLRYQKVLQTSENLETLKFEKRQLEKLLKFNGAKYNINFVTVDKRYNFGSFDNIFILSFFSQHYFIFYFIYF